ncbi:MAG: hypothetical protein BWK76_14385 [Desulfobulbaceae bacterium A2]|nr:MAG: hypothetical protein BWK76_14385 [Desulfobulbaceae bacterium A2]
MARPAVIITFFQGDMPFQAIEVMMDDVPFARVEVTVVAHAIDAFTNAVQFAQKLVRLVPGKRAVLDAPLDSFKVDP